METKGAILKRRIKESGYTQIEFADACEISVTILKRYMKDEVPYSIKLLEKFSELLNCSTDYLLGRAETPQKEIQTLKEQTHLSDSALLFLKKCNDDYLNDNISDEAERNLAVISSLLENSDLIRLLKNWIYFDETVTPMNDLLPIVISDITVKPDEICGALFLTIQERLCKIKYQLRGKGKKQNHI